MKIKLLTAGGTSMRWQFIAELGAIMSRGIAINTQLLVNTYPEESYDVHTLSALVEDYKIYRQEQIEAKSIEQQIIERVLENLRESSQQRKIECDVRDLLEIGTKAIIPYFKPDMFRRLPSPSTSVHKYHNIYRSRARSGL